jgi:hypothetical protein
MDRRAFLKRIAGFSLGLAAVGVSLPTSAKCKVIAPVSDLIAENFLDKKIKSQVQKIKSEQPELRIGETHCHSIFSDGNFPIRQLMERSASLGLDFLVITEHIIPKQFSLEDSLLSFKERLHVFENWKLKNTPPIDVYPAFEISTLQGHLILILPPQFLKDKYHSDIRSQFSKYSHTMDNMDNVAQLANLFGGASIIPHPAIERSYPFGAPIDFIKQNLTGLVHGIEDVSTGHGYDIDYSKELNMASVGSSDDHFNMTIGTTVTGYDSNLHSNLIAALQAKATQAIKIDESLNDLFTAARIVL